MVSGRGYGVFTRWLRFVGIVRSGDSFEMWVCEVVRGLGCGYGEVAQMIRSEEMVRWSCRERKLSHHADKDKVNDFRVFLNNKLKCASVGCSRWEVVEIKFHFEEMDAFMRGSFTGYCLKLKCEVVRGLGCGYGEVAQMIRSEEMVRWSCRERVHPWIKEVNHEKIHGVMDCQKLTLEACTHASQNERLPLQPMVRVLSFEQLQVHQAIARKLMNADIGPSDVERLQVFFLLLLLKLAAKLLPSMISRLIAILGGRTLSELDPAYFYIAKNTYGGLAAHFV
ncbi:BTB/POZ domain-containing protein [Artemisia annua]|uniref:BTB/POZ domain-containing protein n=1 Tax=Artemisia annua TaxID=35608 RepID=A0A2U1NCE3_ARTAN|nr:BTB/POZ domain-containing protein [Artemisia annua]